jgi:hypothetical protein
MPPRKAQPETENQSETTPVEIEAEAPVESGTPVESEAATPVEAVTEAVEETVETVEAVAESAPVEEIAKPADQAIDAVTATQQETLETIETVGATMLENVTRAQRAIADFVSTRIREDLEAQQQLLRCKSFDEVRSVQSKFIKTAMEQYKSEAARLFKLGAATVTKSNDAA